MRPVMLKRGCRSKYMFSQVWIYQNDIEILPDAGAGDIVDVYYEEDKYLGRGFYCPASKIAVRLLTNRKEHIDRLFLR